METTKFFVHKRAFVKKKLLLLIDADGVTVTDAQSNQRKERMEFEMVSFEPCPKNPTDIIVHKGKKVDTWMAADRLPLLSVLQRLRAVKVMETLTTQAQKIRKDFSEHEINVVMKGSSIVLADVATGQETTFDLVHIDQILRVEDDTNLVVLRGPYKVVAFSLNEADSFATEIQRRARKMLSAEVTRKLLTRHEYLNVMNQTVNLDELDTVDAVERWHRTSEGWSKARLAARNGELLELEEEGERVVRCIRLELLVCIVRVPTVEKKDHWETFDLYFRGGNVCQYRSKERDLVISNLIEACSSARHSLPLWHERPSAAHITGPFGAKPELAYLEILQKPFSEFTKLTYDEKKSILDDLIVNAPFGEELPLKGKTVLGPLVMAFSSLIESKADTGFIIRVLLAMHHCIRWRGAFDAVNFESFDSLFSCLRIEQSGVATAAALFIRSLSRLYIVVHKGVKGRRRLQSVVVKHLDLLLDVLEKMISQKPLNAIVTMCVLELLETGFPQDNSVCVKSLINFRSHLTKLLRSRSLPITRSVSSLVNIMMTCAPHAGQELEPLQLEFLKSGTLLWNLHSAVASPDESQRERSLLNVETLIGNHPECSTLMRRIFPESWVDHILTCAEKKVAEDKKAKIHVEYTVVPWKDVFEWAKESQRSPRLVWDPKNMQYLGKRLKKELTALQFAESNEDGHFVWNYHEFSVSYPLAKEFHVDGYYLQYVIDPELGAGFSIRNPRQLLESILLILFEENIPEEHVSLCFKTIAFIYCTTDLQKTRFPFFHEMIELVRLSSSLSLREHALEALTAIYAANVVENAIREPSQLSWVQEVLKNPQSTIGMKKNVLKLLSSGVQQSQDGHENSIIRPIPRASRILGETEMLHTVVNVMECGDAGLMEECFLYLDRLTRVNDHIIEKLHESNIFFYVLSYPGSDFVNAASLLRRTHRKQGLPDGDSILANFLPKPMINALDNFELSEFANAFCSSCANPELLWEPSMRAVLQETAAECLKTGNYPAFCVKYARLKHELVIENLYLRFFVDPSTYRKSFTLDKPRRKRLLSALSQEMVDNMHNYERLGLCLHAIHILFKQFIVDAAPREYAFPHFKALLGLLTPMTLDHAREVVLRAMDILFLLLSKLPKENSTVIVQNDGARALADMFSVIHEQYSVNPSPVNRNILINTIGCLDMLAEHRLEEVEKVIDRSFMYHLLECGDRYRRDDSEDNMYLTQSVLHFVTAMQKSSRIRIAMWNSKMALLAFWVVVSDASALWDIAARALFSIVHFSDGEIVIPQMERVRVHLHSILPRVLASSLFQSFSKPEDFLKYFSGDYNVRSTYLIWNSGLRAELYDYLKHELDSRETFDDAGTFETAQLELKPLEYVSLEKELVVEEAFVDVVLEKGAGELRQPIVFLRSLGVTLSTFSKMAIEGQETTRKGLSCTGACRSCLLAMRLMVKDGVVGKEFADPSFLSDVAGALGVNHDEVLKECFSLLEDLVKSKKYGKEACSVIESGEVMPLISKHLGPSHNHVEVLIRCLSLCLALARASKTIFSHFCSYGVAMYCSVRLCSFDDDANVRRNSSELLGLMLRNEKDGVVRSFLSAGIPATTVKQLKDHPSQGPDLVEAVQETPEVMWNDDVRGEFLQKMTALAKAFEAKQDQNIMATTSCSFESPIEFECLKDQLVIEHVFVSVYNRMPTFSLTDPTKFGLGLANAISSMYHGSAVNADTIPRLKTYLEALYNVAKAYPIVVDKAIGNVDFTALFDILTSVDEDEVASSILRLLQLIMSNRKAIVHFLDLGYPVQKLLEFFKNASTTELCDRVLHILIEFVNHNRKFIPQLLDASVCDVLMGKCEQISKSSHSSSALRTKDMCLDMLRLLYGDRTYGDSSKEHMEQSKYWSTIRGFVEDKKEEEKVQGQGQDGKEQGEQGEGEGEGEGEAGSFV
eukprot:TRINITY_DN1058_c0_g1_i1.p1 TRINITY_DN1058_c0_g1~~TRINITY_DN1058_c0_g1_i1.p1  ORF type:complete len:1926 (+),score=530.09 TRINITY_DN1058_c0_g1_i1:63-5840(+)